MWSPMHTVYILAQAGRGSPRRQTYVGYTAREATARLVDHNGGRCDATRAGAPWALGVAITGFRTKNAALAFESQLQQQPARGLRQKVEQARRLATGPRWEAQSLTVQDSSMATVQADDDPFDAVRTVDQKLF